MGVLVRKVGKGNGLFEHTCHLLDLYHQVHMFGSIPQTGLGCPDCSYDTGLALENKVEKGNGLWEHIYHLPDLFHQVHMFDSIPQKG